MILSPGLLGERVQIFVAEWQGASCPSGPLSAEAVEQGGTVSWMTLEACMQAIDAGHLEDAKTELALQRFIKLRNLNRLETSW